MAPKIKRPAIAVPQTRQEFETLGVDLAEKMRETERKALEASDAIARIKLALELEGAQRSAEIASMWAAFSAYAEAHQAALLPGDRKSIALACGIVGWRKGNPKVEIEDEDTLIAHCEIEGLERYLRAEIRINKEAILEDRAFADLPGVEIKQGTVFFFKPLDLEKEKTKTSKTAIGEAA